MDRAARAKIDSLLYEVRRFPERAPWDIEALARRYQLDPVIIRGLLETEGAAMLGDDDDEGADPNGTTQVMSVDDLGLG
jgi:hypothetical protein